MKVLLFSVLTFCALFVVGCKPEEDDKVITTDADYYVFGHFYGFCAGEQCREIFKIQDGHLYEDTNDTYPSSNAPYVANWVMLPQEKYDLVSNAIDNMPSELLAVTDTVVGIPDAGDWGGLYIEYKVGDTHRYWLVDMMPVAGSEYLDAFVQATRDDITLINQ